MLNLLKIFKDEFGRTKKTLGQHFLTNNHVLELIVKSAGISADDFVVEIGPGCGVLTYEALKTDAHVKAIEVDGDLVEFLNRYLHLYKNFEVEHMDFLKMTDLGTDKKVIFLGNLPYNISTKIVQHLVSFISQIKTAVFMFQKEVADRLISMPKHKTYSSISVFTQYFFEIEKIKNISGKNFLPTTKVESTILKLTPKERYFTEVEREKDFLKFVRECFVTKRKTLKNNLKNVADIEDKIEKFFGNKNIRGEEMELRDFIRFYEFIFHK